jgi:hypothetical protein
VTVKTEFEFGKSLVLPVGIDVMRCPLEDVFGFFCVDETGDVADAGLLFDQNKALDVLAQRG